MTSPKRQTTSGTFGRPTRRALVILPVAAVGLLVQRCLARAARPAPSRAGAIGGIKAVPRPAGAISVKNFGARGDGQSDDSAAIIAADAAAAKAGRALYFPAGTYAIVPLRATTSWSGAAEGRSVLRYRGGSDGFVTLITASHVDGIRFTDLHFDGQVSGDPAKWDTASHDRFTGAAGLSIDSCRDAVVSRCSAVDMRQHGFRMLKVRGGRMEGCATRRSRGTFGDGFLILSSIEVTITDCVAEDYTRIGFVADRTDATEPMCQRITLRDCTASQGHHASSNYGGSEYNAGVWLENCTSALIERVTTRANPDRGINACTGKKTSDIASAATIELRKCRVDGGTFGICIYSLADLPVTADVSGCTVERAVIAFQAAANNSSDVFVWTDCRASYDASATNGRGFATEVTALVQGKPSFTIGKGCVVTRWKEDRVKLEDPGDGAATADIGGYYAPAGAMRLTVDGAREVAGRPLYVRWYNDRPHDISIRDADAYVSSPDHGTTITAQGASIRSRRVDPPPLDRR